MHYDLNRGECIIYFSVNALQSYIVLATLPNKLIHYYIFIAEITQNYLNQIQYKN